MESKNPRFHVFPGRGWNSYGKKFRFRADHVRQRFQISEFIFDLVHRVQKPSIEGDEVGRVRSQIQIENRIAESIEPMIREGVNAAVLGAAVEAKHQFLGGTGLLDYLRNFFNGIYAWQHRNDVIADCGFKARSNGDLQSEEA